MMPGGDKDAYNVMKPIFEAIAAKVDGVPCVTYIGPGASGHFVKMVHNGIEYGLMQLLAETYEILKNGLKLDNNAIQKIFADWNAGRLQSFLMEITADIFTYKAPGTDHLLLDDIKDEARANRRLLIPPWPCAIFQNISNCASRQPAFTAPRIQAWMVIRKNC
jgi:6-phosphogluconate dehydrogenase